MLQNFNSVLFQHSEFFPCSESKMSKTHDKTSYLYTQRRYQQSLRCFQNSLLAKYVCMCLHTQESRVRSSISMPLCSFSSRLWVKLRFKALMCSDYRLIQMIRVCGVRVQSVSVHIKVLKLLSSILLLVYLAWSRILVLPVRTNYFQWF